MKKFEDAKDFIENNDPEYKLEWGTYDWGLNQDSYVDKRLGVVLSSFLQNFNHFVIFDEEVKDAHVTRAIVQMVESGYPW